MYADSLLPTLQSIARRAAEAEGVEVAWVELKRHGGAWVFRVFIERQEGTVGLADCERVSHRLSLLLDVEDPIDSAYTLEVSTPGLDRPLRNESDYERFTGRLARLKTRQAVGGRKRILGRLQGVQSGHVLLVGADGEKLSIPFSAIESGRLEVEFAAPLGSAGREGGQNRGRVRKQA